MPTPHALLRALVAALSLLFAALAVPAAAHADDLSSGESATLRLQPCLLAADALAADDWRAAARSRGFNCSARQTDMAGSEFWVRLAIDRPFSAQGFRLRWTSTWQSAATFHFLYADGTMRRTRVTQQQASRIVQTGAIMQLPVPVERAALASIYVRVEGAANARGVLLNPELMPADVAAENNRLLALLYGGFLGLCVALFFYNLMIWTALRQSYLLSYCGMLVAIMVYAVSSSGLLPGLIPDLANNDRLRINYLSLSLVACFALAFARTFIEPHIFTRGMRLAATAVGAQMLVLGLSFALLAPWQIKLLDNLYFASFGIGLAYLALAFVRGVRAGSIYTRLYVLSWSAPLLLSAVRVAHGFGLVPQSFLLDNSTLIAMTIEAILSSMIIAYRIRTVQNDRDSARLREHEARLLADTDPLTGLLNRRALLKVALPETPGRWRLLLIDIDHFKRVNDHVGHDAGDEVLQTVAGIIHSSLRQGAIAARLGGEEFAILFPAVEGERRTYASLLGRVRTTPMPHDADITVSMGLADGPLGPDETLWRELYRRADAALYEAKRRGRNRLHAADDATPRTVPGLPAEAARAA
jgi:diguanylate cyclase (GGDEF)-like protein